MEAFFAQYSQSLEEGTSKLLTLLNEIASVREQCSNLQLSIATLDDPESKLSVLEAEAAAKEIENHISTSMTSLEPTLLENCLVLEESAMKEDHTEKGTDQVQKSVECNEPCTNADDCNDSTMIGGVDQACSSGLIL